MSGGRVRAALAPLSLVLDGRIMAALSAAKGLEAFERPETLDRLEALRERGWMLSRAMYTLPMNLADLVRAAATFILLAAGFAAALGFAAWRVAVGASSQGQLVLVLALAAQVSRETRATFEMIDWTRWVGRIAGHLLWLEETARNESGTAEDTASETTHRKPAPAPDRITEGIAFESVSFRYPGTDALVLDDVSFRLPAGRIVAIVGENGAGKTTLVKLLCRFYEPTRGRILIDGLDLGAMDVAEWRARSSASFQDFHRFQLAAGEAVGIGDLPRLADEAAVRAALERADAAEIPNRLPRGLLTRLGASWEDGVDLSIGQWQKVALARCLMRPAPLLLILDEPTAALDPQTEHSVFERQARAAGIMEGSRGAITLIVSHRFSTVAMADTILVVDGGRIAEHGTHRELLAAGGLYARLYGIQAAAYRN